MKFDPNHLNFDFNQLVVLGLIFLIGIIVGVLLSPRTKPLRRQLEIEHRQREAAEAQLAEANRRVGELEHKTRNHPHWGSTALGDNLTLINGVGPDSAEALKREGLTTYSDVARLSDTELGDLENRLGRTRGTIVREGWREQAARLRDQTS